MSVRGRGGIRRVEGELAPLSPNPDNILNHTLVQPPSHPTLPSLDPPQPSQLGTSPQMSSRSEVEAVDVVEGEVTKVQHNLLNYTPVRHHHNLHSPLIHHNILNCILGRGTKRGRGRGRSNRPQSSQLRTSSPPSPGATSAASPLIGLSSLPPHSADPPSREPILVPPSGDIMVIGETLYLWRLVSNPIKYQFESDYDRNMARTVWEKTCMDRYPDYLKHLRGIALKKVNSQTWLTLGGHGPRGMRTDIWNGLVDIWLTSEWRRKSDAARSNRAAKPDAVLHTGGSKTLELELEHPVSARDVYDHVHKRKMGNISLSTRRTFLLDSYDAAMIEKYGDDYARHPIVDPEVWAKVSGSNKKRRFLGGHSLDIEPMLTPPSKVTEPSRLLGPTQQDIKDAVNAAMTSFVQTQMVPMLHILTRIAGSQPRNLPSKPPSQDGAAGQNHEGDNDGTVGENNEGDDDVANWDFD
ncbi:putative transposase, Ptta/En/Spm, plant [Sesbania bispinosa]|nr:putative transposase, Ptta/En/Spm, plant [Sesbania bispinosa]